MRKLLIVSVSVLAFSVPALAQQGQPGRTQAPAGETTMPQGMQGPVVQQGQMQEQVQQPNTYRTSELVGATVRNQNGEEIATIDDLIAAPDGSLHSAVLAFGGFLGLGEKRVAVNFNELKWSGQGSNVQAQVSMTTEQVRNAPAFQYRENTRK